MEDRLTPGLYLEMCDRDPAAYAEERLPALLALPGVLRASWWSNERPHRSEFPRTLPEFTTLGLCEVDERFARPQGLDDVRGLHFLRTPRPGQGSLSGRPTLGLELVLISPRDPEGAQALRDWGDFVHLRHIAAAGVPGFTMITPYENADAGSPRFLHLYEMDTPDAEEAFQRMTPLTEERRIGPRGSAEWKAWAGHEQLAIDYVSTFRRVGAKSA